MAQLTKVGSSRDKDTAHVFFYTEESDMTPKLMESRNKRLRTVFNITKDKKMFLNFVGI
jgi:hypothetical protein